MLESIQKIGDVTDLAFMIDTGDPNS